MKILLIGNFPYLKNESMDRYADMLASGLKERGHFVKLIKPKPILSRIKPSAHGLGKWLGYLDRFLFFRLTLRKTTSWADIIHICDQANAIYFPLLGSRPSVITCHDMIAIRRAIGDLTGYTTKFTGILYQKWILLELRKFRHMVCVSEATYNDANKILGGKSHKFALISNGQNYPYRRMRIEEAELFLHKLNLRQNDSYFIHVGGNIWNKNREGLLKIFAEIIKFTDAKLILVGEPLNTEQKILSDRIKISTKIKEVGKITNEQLCALYSTAKGLIFPSLFEGFGWPIIEAQACGCPVFTSDLKPMTEIGGDAAIYFDPTKTKSAARIIINSMKKKESIKKRGYRNVNKYSSNNMISKYIKFYHLCISSHEEVDYSTNSVMKQQPSCL